MMSILVSAAITVVGILLAYAQWRRDLRVKLEAVHDDVLRDLVQRRVEPFTDFMARLEPMSRRRSGDLVANRELARQHAEIFHQAIYSPVGLLASTETREIIIYARAGCLQFSDWAISATDLQNRVWAVHQALRSDLGLPQALWMNEVERRRLRLTYGSDDAVEDRVRSAIHLTYDLYGPLVRFHRSDLGWDFSAVILDMDGLMIDSERVERQAWQAAAREFGQSVSDEEFESLVGRGARDVRAILTSLWTARSTSPPDYAAVLRRKAELAQTLPVAPKPGVTELLDWARSETIPVAVASSSHRPLILSRLRATRLLDGLDLVVSGDDVSRGKPHPDIFLLAAKRLGAKAKDCVVLEDSPSGITAARTAGMRCLLVPDRSVRVHAPGASERLEADAVLPSLVEALSCLSRS